MTPGAEGDADERAFVQAAPLSAAPDDGPQQDVFRLAAGVEEQAAFGLLAHGAKAKPALQPRTTPSTPLDALDHRARVRARFERVGADGFDETELLELLLFRSVPRRDTKPIAKALLKRFGSLPAALNAAPRLLREIDGVGDAVAFDLGVLGALTRAAAKADLPRRESLLGSWDKVIAHVRAAMAHETREQFRILFLNKKNALIADEVQQRGTIDHTPVYPREIVKRALELSASALILVHNHPSGDPSPSSADVEMTHRIKEIAQSLDIAVHDHLIVGRNGYVSLKAEGLM